VERWQLFCAETTLPAGAPGCRALLRCWQMIALSAAGFAAKFAPISQSLAARKQADLQVFT
jgi:hypothetical protein